MHEKVDVISEFTANAIESWNINPTEYTKYNFNNQKNKNSST